MRPTGYVSITPKWLLALALAFQYATMTVSYDSVQGDKPGRRFKANVILLMYTDQEYMADGMANILESIVNAADKLDDIEAHYFVKIAYLDIMVTFEINNVIVKQKMEEFLNHSSDSSADMQRTMGTEDAASKMGSSWPKIRVLLVMFPILPNQTVQEWKQSASQESTGMDSAFSIDVHFFFSNTSAPPWYNYIRSPRIDVTGWSSESQQSPMGLESSVSEQIASRIQQLLTACNCSKWVPTSNECHYVSEPDWSRCAYHFLQDFSHLCVNYLMCTDRTVKPGFEKYCLSDNSTYRLCDDQNKCLETCRNVPSVIGECNATCKNPSGFRKVDKLFEYPDICCQELKNGVTYPLLEKCSLDCLKSSYIIAGSVLVIIALGLVIGIPLCVWFCFIVPRRVRLQKLADEEKLDDQKMKEARMKRYMAAKMKHVKHMAKAKTPIVEIAGQGSPALGSDVPTPQQVAPMPPPGTPHHHHVKKS